MSVVRVPVPVVAPGPAPDARPVITSRFGLLQIPEEELYRMPEGLPGFPDLAEWLLLAPEPGSLFYWWQSASDPGIALPLIDPRIMEGEAFRISMDEADVLRLKLAERGPVQALAVVTVPPHRPEALTVNLAAPLVMATEQRLAWQLILERSDHRIAVPLLPALQQ